MIDTEIKCDECLKILNEKDVMPGFFLTLTSEKKPTGEVVNCICVYPSIDGTKNFCGLNCLKKWIDDLFYVHN